MRIVCWDVCFGSRQFDTTSQDGHERSRRKRDVDDRRGLTAKAWSAACILLDSYDI